MLLEDLRRMQFENLADDLVLDSRMLGWTEEQVLAYFHSGGEQEPSGSPSSVSIFSFSPAIDEIRMEDKPMADMSDARQTGNADGPGAMATSEQDAEPEPSEEHEPLEEQELSEEQEPPEEQEASGEEKPPEQSSPSGEPDPPTTPGQPTRKDAVSLDDLELAGGNLPELSILASHYPTQLAARLRVLGFKSLGSRLQLAAALKDKYRTAQRRAMFNEPVDRSERFVTTETRESGRNVEVEAYLLGCLRDRSSSSSVSDSVHDGYNGDSSDEFELVESEPAAQDSEPAAQESEPQFAAEEQVPKPIPRGWTGPAFPEPPAFDVRGGLSSSYYYAAVARDQQSHPVRLPAKLTPEELASSARIAGDAPSAVSSSSYYYAHNRKVDYRVPVAKPKLISVHTKPPPPPLWERGGAILILSPGRKHLWPRPPRSLNVVDAVMGATMRLESVRAMNVQARQELTRGEMGILMSNAKAWKHALQKGWEWALVLEDDVSFKGIDTGLSSSAAAASWLQRLPRIVKAATEAQPDWQLLVLTPINSPWDFYDSLEAELVPDLVDVQGKRRRPSHATAPVYGCGSASTSVEWMDNIAVWYRCPPTFHAFGWIYRRELMNVCTEAFIKGSTPFNPLDIWVWEVLAVAGLSDCALAPARSLLDSQGVGKSAPVPSVKEQQDKQEVLHRIYRGRGHG